MVSEREKPSRKQLEEEFRRKLVLDVAEELFAERGFDGTTVADIAEAAELAKGSIYQLFQSKEEIILAIIRRKVDQISSRLNEIFERSVSPAEKIKDIIRTKLEAVWENRKFASIFFHELRGFHWCIETPLMAIYRDSISFFLRKFEEIIEEAQRLGEIRSDIPARVLVSMIGGLSNGIIFMWLREPGSVDLESAVWQVQDLFFKGAALSGRGEEIDKTSDG